MIDPSGTEKTHLAVALGRLTCIEGRKVRFFRFMYLAEKLTSTHTHGTHDRFRKHLLDSELIILDELGFISLNADGSELHFHILLDLSMKYSVIISSNLKFFRGGADFTDTMLINALVDRLSHNARILHFVSASYRMGRSIS